VSPQELVPQSIAQLHESSDPQHIPSLQLLGHAASEHAVSVPEQQPSPGTSAVQSAQLHGVSPAPHVPSGHVAHTPATQDPAHGQSEGSDVQSSPPLQQPSPETSPQSPQLQAVSPSAVAQHASPHVDAQGSAGQLHASSSGSQIPLPQSSSHSPLPPSQNSSNGSQAQSSPGSPHCVAPAPDAQLSPTAQVASRHDDAQSGGTAPVSQNSPAAHAQSMAGSPRFPQLSQFSGGVHVPSPLQQAPGQSAGHEQLSSVPEQQSSPHVCGQSAHEHALSPIVQTPGVMHEQTPPAGGGGVHPPPHGQSPGQLSQPSPKAGSQVPSPQRVHAPPAPHTSNCGHSQSSPGPPQALQVSAPSQTPLPLQQAPGQSVLHVQASSLPEQQPSPQESEQPSAGQLHGVSFGGAQPPPGLGHPGVAQSLGHVLFVSAPLQQRSPQTSVAQSPGQLQIVSPGSQTPVPQPSHCPRIAMQFCPTGHAQSTGSTPQSPPKQHPSVPGSDMQSAGQLHRVSPGSHTPVPHCCARAVEPSRRRELATARMPHVRDARR
jgi:hypothetical protein